MSTVEEIKELLLKNKRNIAQEMRESKELMILLTKATHTKLTIEEKRKVKEQLLDILKGIPALAIFLLPGGALLLPLFIKFIPDILPSAYRNDNIDIVDNIVVDNIIVDNEDDIKNRYDKSSNQINLSYFDSFPVLTTDRLLLRPITIEDAKDIYEIRSNESVMKFMDSKIQQDISESVNFIQKGLGRYQAKSGIFWAITDRVTGAFIGDIAYWKVDLHHALAELGYTLKTSYWGKGMMSEALKSVILFGFENLKLHRIEATITPTNENSKKLLLKHGFQKEVILRQNIQIDDQYIDSEIYGLLHNDYLSNNSIP